MLDGLGQSTAPQTITNLASFYPTAPYLPSVQGQITNLASFYPTMTGTLAPSGGGAIPTSIIQAAIAAGLTTTQFTQQAVNAGYSPTQWAAMAVAQRQAALQSGGIGSGAPTSLSASNLTPILLAGGAVLLLIMMRK